MYDYQMYSAAIVKKHQEAIVILRILYYSLGILSSILLKNTVPQESHYKLPTELMKHTHKILITVKIVYVNSINQLFFLHCDTFLCLVSSFFIENVRIYLNQD